ncbi:MAG: agmatine deiminase family protein [Phycisphaeraceae bacterium]|nr:agmatine deiminase family protein [Phycisphaeraceae bacterium]MCB9848841.1 agmatine deiminase family protein [Phycisphaeraceae bacterium]
MTFRTESTDAMRTIHRRVLTATILAAIAGAAAAADVEQVVPTPQYPEGAAIPRNMTPEEAAYTALHPLTTPRAVTPPPTGPVRAVAEYEPMEGIILAYEGTSGWLAILNQMAANITTTGNAKVYVYCDSASEANVAAFNMELAGADPARIVTLVKTTDTIWCRDYGPRYVYEGDVRAIVDHTYNRPRPNDNSVPAHFAGYTGHELYELPLVHGGGNYHLEATGPAWSTELIANENGSLTEQQIIDIWNDYEGTTTTITDAFPSSVDSTQHIDMWDIMIADNAAIVSDFPLASGSAQDQVCDNHAAALANAGYTVHRVPAVGSPFNTHFTYTNAVICNNLVLVPYYDTIPNAGTYNAQALSVWQAALPGYTIVQIDCDAIVTSAGVMHCICMHVPVNKNGANPGAYLVNLNGGETFDPGDMVVINWLSDDDQGVSNVDLLLSLNGGASFDTVIASATADDGAFTWTVPDVFSDQARVRVVARDAQGNTGFDDSDADFTINGAPACTGDLNGDGVVDTADLGILLSAFGAHGVGDPADLNNDMSVDTADLGILLGVFGSGCP